MAKMEVSYSRQLDYQYMMIDAGEDVVTDYRLSMLIHNRITGFLPVHIQQMNGKSTLSYEITSLEALPAFLAARKITYDEMVSLLLQFCSAVQEVGRYLLDGEGILLEPEFIYISKSLEQVRFCYYPYQHTPLYQSVNVLCRFLIDHIDYDDRKSLELSYGLFQESLKENLSIRAIVGCITAKLEESKENADELVKSVSGEYTDDVKQFASKENRVKQKKVVSQKDTDELIGSPLAESYVANSQERIEGKQSSNEQSSGQKIGTGRANKQSKKIALSEKGEASQNPLKEKTEKKQGMVTVFCTILIIGILGYVLFTAGKRLLQLEIVSENLLIAAAILIILAAASAGLVAYWILKPKH